MSPRVRWLLAGVAAIGVTAAALAQSGILRSPPAPIVVTPELVTEGHRVYLRRCHTCHNDVPLAKRVKDWKAEHAYDVLGRLPKVYRAMPPFPGTDDERRALAAWIQALGSGQTPQY
jgi:mono/diheme cytochrome c family protein